MVVDSYIPLFRQVLELIVRLVFLCPPCSRETYRRESGQLADAAFSLLLDKNEKL